jgi:hypothetical protein
MPTIFSFIALLLLLLGPVSAQVDIVLSLEQQVAQMFMVTVHGAELPLHQQKADGVSAYQRTRQTLGASSCIYCQQVNSRSRNHMNP